MEGKLNSKRSVPHDAEKPKFRCDEPGCGKVFFRSEHLSRHRLNHNPKVLFHCPWEKCTKKFVRNDLLTRHLKRHQNRKDKTSQESSENRSDQATDEIQTIRSPDQVVGGRLQPNENSSLISWLFDDGLVDPLSVDFTLPDKMVNNTNTTTSFHPGSLFFENDETSPTSVLMDIFSRETPPEFLNKYTANFSKVSRSNLVDIAKLVPSLATNSNFTVGCVEYFLDIYWRYFHHRFPILHKPTFDASSAPPLLLLSMIMLGARFCLCEDVAPDIDDPMTIANTIAEPLRWLLFSSPEFTPPAKTWVFQSLIMLEFFEKNCSSRTFHERAHLHHGTTIQLLRRSPCLGGNPYGDVPEDMGNPSKEDVWHKWIERESMKRVTFMCFYMDAVDAIGFGHQLLIFAHQLQLSLPCDDSMWENMKFDQSLATLPKPLPFLVALKNLLTRTPVSTSSYGKKILLAGLSSVMFQLQQRDIQLSFGLDGDTNEAHRHNWRDMITVALSIWRNEVGISCCSSKFADPLLGIAQYSKEDTRCKCTTYHMAFIFQGISYYDFSIFAGAPWRMSVVPSSRDRQAISERVYAWAKSREGAVCACQAYLILWEMFLSPQDDVQQLDYQYDPVSDAFMRSNAIGLCVTVLWCYNFCNYAIESVIEAPPKESLHGYLRRTRSEFCNLTGVVCHSHFLRISGWEFHNALGKYVAALPSVTNKQNMVGMCLEVSNMLDKGFALSKEHSRLLKHIAMRCLGSKKLVCDRMYG